MGFSRSVPAVSLEAIAAVRRALPALTLPEET
jgi:hypothetical protein